MEQKLEIIPARIGLGERTKLTIAKDRVSIKFAKLVPTDEQEAMIAFALKVNALVQPVPKTLRGGMAGVGSATLGPGTGTGRLAERRAFACNDRGECVEIAQRERRVATPDVIGRWSNRFDQWLCGCHGLSRWCDEDIERCRHCRYVRPSFETRAAEWSAARAAR